MAGVGGGRTVQLEDRAGIFRGAAREAGFGAGNSLVELPFQPTGFSAQRRYCRCAPAHSGGWWERLFFPLGSNCFPARCSTHLARRVLPVSPNGGATTPRRLSAPLRAACPASKNRPGRLGSAKATRRIGPARKTLWSGRPRARVVHRIEPDSCRRRRGRPH